VLTVIFAIFFIAAIILGICAYRQYIKMHKNDAPIGLIVCTVLCAIVSLVIGCVCLFLWGNVATEYAIDQKIEMYQTENAEIETEIDAIVKEYMTHEKETFENISPDSDAMVLVSMFPELKSDELIKRQIDLHAKNAAEIKRLKESKIDLAMDKWLLYFGR
jgi:hypothetical protein